jgi:HPt (histidine-containing phosphotransfer) domain-containing protein
MDEARAPMDLDGALQIALGDRDFLKELIDLYMTETDPAIEKLKGAVLKGEADLVMKLAHSLKSSSGNLHALAVRDCAFKLEQMGRNQELTGAREVLDELCREYGRLQSYTSTLVL